MRITATLALVGLFFFGCNTNKSDSNQGDTKFTKSDSQRNKVEVELIEKKVKNRRHTANWANPVLNPVGSNLGEYVRALFITGQEELLWRFFWDESSNSIPRESPYESLKTNNWGYEIDLTQLKWSIDSVHFTLFYKTTINNTSGIEEIEGIIVNDTGRILIN